MSQSPLEKAGSKRYQDAWRAINILIRSNGSWSGNERNTCYLNSGEGSFRDVSFISGLDLPVDGRSFVFLDLEHDGDQDLILKSRTGPQLQVFRNDYSPSQTAPRSLFLELVGDPANRDAVGARATLKTNRRELTRFVQSGSGFLSQSSRRLHFGLSAEEEPLSLEVAWSDGSRQQLNELPEKGLLRLVQGKPEPQEMRPERPESAAPSPHPFLSEATGTWLLEPLPAPDFQLAGLDGKTYRLSELQGNKILINFWATWCIPCGKELAGWVAHSGELAATGLQVLAVSVDEPQDRQAVSQFAARLGLPFPVLYA
ncbi:MAG: redoxin domain-containing protein, partial [Acidobacteriota bacterium]